MQAYIVVFFMAHGLNQTLVYAVQAIYSTVVAVAGVPGGRFADRRGYRRSMVIGSVLLICPYIIYLFANGFVLFAVALMVSGLGTSLVADVDTALLSDTTQVLLVGRPQAERRSMMAHNRTIERVFSVGGMSFGGFVSIWIFHFGFTALLVVQIFIYTCLALVASLLREPVRTIPVSADGNTVWRVVRQTLHGQPEIRWLIMCSAVGNGVTYLMVWLAQPYYKLLGIPEARFGMVVGIQYSLQGLLTLTTSRFLKFGDKRRRTLFLLLIGTAAMSYVALGLWPRLWVFALATAGLVLVRAVTPTIMTVFIDDLISGTANVRATIHSTEGTAGLLFVSSVSPLFGLLVDLTTLRLTLVVIGCFFMACGVAVMATMPKGGKIIESL
jgi:MFS family permease